MAASPLEVVRALYPLGRTELTAPGALDGWVAAIAELAHPDFVAGNPREEMLTMAFDAEEFGRVWRDWLSAWETWRVDVLGHEQGSGGRVFVAMDIEARSRRDSVEMSARGANVVEVCDGRIKRIELYFDREDARRAAGLET